MPPSQTDRIPSALAERSIDMARPRVLLVSLVVLALALALGWARMQPPRAAGVDAPLEAFSAGRALAVLRDLLVENQPRPVGSAQNARVRERIVARLEGWATKSRCRRPSRVGGLLENGSARRCGTSWSGYQGARRARPWR